MIARSFDAERVNRLVNDAAIRPYVGGKIDQRLDLSQAVSDQNNWFLLGEHGGFAYVLTGLREYEVHTFVLPYGRGKWAMQAAAAGLATIAPMADRIWTRIAPHASNVRAFAVRNQFKQVGTEACDLGKGPETFDIFEWRPLCPSQQSSVVQS